MRKFIFILSCFVAFLQQHDLCSGMGNAEEMHDHKITIIKKQDNGTRINVKCGDSIRMELTEIGGGGYSWYVDDLNTEYLELVSKETKVISGERVGAPAAAEWLFKTKKKGSTKIKMDHYRIWEGKERATEHFSIELTIE